MKNIVELLREKGYKITPQRRAVISALLAGEKFSTAQQVLEFVKKTNPDISLDTVYRNISLLIELGIVHEVHKRNRDGNVFEIVAAKHHHHLICTECGQTECLHVCPVGPEIIKAAAEQGFEVSGHLFELYGKCNACRVQK